MTPDRILFLFFRLFAAAFFEIVEAVTENPDDAGEVLAGKRRSFFRPPVVNMKPERIQFWLRQLGSFLIEVADGMAGETGKSGSAADGSAEKVTE